MCYFFKLKKIEIRFTISQGWLNALLLLHSYRDVLVLQMMDSIAVYDCISFMCLAALGCRRMKEENIKSNEHVWVCISISV